VCARLSLKTVALAVATLLTVGFPASAPAAEMDKAHLLKKGQFKIYDGNLTADQKRCLAFALKQWVMYDQAPAADNDANRNQTNTDVTAAGPDHEWSDAGLHTRSSRSMSAGEKQLMKDAYGDTSPFHAPGQPVKDPTQANSGWFTGDEGDSDLTIKIADQIPDCPSGTLGYAQFHTPDHHDSTGTGEIIKGKFPEAPATIWMKRKPGDRTWWYPNDEHPDGWITNEDHNTPLGMRDWYMIVKHELGHYFSFSHRGDESLTIEDPPPVYDPPVSFCATAMTPFDEKGACEAGGGEFSLHATRIYFSSNRPGGYGGYDIWFATWNDSLSLWVNPTNCGPALNGPRDEIDPFEGVGGGILYFASNRPGGSGGYDIYQAKAEMSAVWDSVSALPTGINTAADETGPCERPDRFYFASNRGGGFGGNDLYVAMLSPHSNIEWLPPSNLGAPINSVADDLDPEISIQRGDSLAVLYFASDRGGPLATGGFDIFRAELHTGSWSAPVNPGPPLNTPYNETDPSIAIGNKYVYCASDRPEGHGGWDLYTARNMAPRPAVVWDHNGDGTPSQVVTVAFDVYNHGFAPILVYPNVQETDGWPIQFNPQPFQLGPDASASFPVQVLIPPPAPVGTRSKVILFAQVQGRLAFASDFAWVHVLSAGGVQPTDLPAAIEFAVLPNPSRDEVQFAFRLPARGDVRIEIFNVAGRRVRSFAIVGAAAGAHAVLWDGHDDGGQETGSGMYFARLRAGGVEVRRSILRIR